MIFFNLSLGLLGEIVIETVTEIVIGDRIGIEKDEGRIIQTDVII
jgi:hypothetical protein